MGPAVVAWRPLLYIFRWNVNLLYYCTQCNGSNIWPQAFFSFFFFFSTLRGEENKHTSRFSRSQLGFHFFWEKKNAWNLIFFLFGLKFNFEAFFFLPQGESVSPMCLLSAAAAEPWGEASGVRRVFMHWFICVRVCVCSSACDLVITSQLNLLTIYVHPALPPPPRHLLTDWLTSSLLLLALKYNTDRMREPDWSRPQVPTSAVIYSWSESQQSQQSEQ